MAKTKRINLALQGGGAHGAFTWGVLDRILEHEEIEIAALSGTSAGALNAAAVKSGLAAGGRSQARDNLAWLWEQVTGMQQADLSAWMSGYDTARISRSIEYSWPYMIGESWSRLISPYSSGPFYQNPLQSIVEKFDMEKVCCNDGPMLFVNATRVRNGKLRVFKGDEITPSAILASACLPTIYRGVVIHDNETGQDEEFWDGGYTGNPALFPMFRKDLPRDIVIININPLERDEMPRTPQQIANRINEISFNSSLLRELRAIDFVQRLLDEDRMSEDQMSRLFIHMIRDDMLMNSLSVATKIVPNAYVIAELKKAGRNAAESFIEAHFRDLGQKSSVDLRALFG